ncbi:class I SAM-dependent methyltransferase [Devosia sp.]|uniref:class I SAM-dependent methyltransferase n=1 Tax=Devosia sp. TaxID=1871048 RepID=UPI0035AE1994
MAQNIYDDDRFLAGYSEFPRSRDGLDATSEWPAFRALLPHIPGKRVIDLGCGFGQLSRWLGNAGARSVLGIDLSAKMLERAVRETASSAVVYRRDNLDELVLAPGSADLIVSSMALHYVEDFGRIARTMFGALAAGGQLVFSVEHPIYAARAVPEWTIAADGRRAFAVADYLVEGRRVTNWIVDGVVKYHRTIGTMLNTLTAAGFTYGALDEWRPTEAQLVDHPEWRETELTRPMFVLCSMNKPAGGLH